MRLAYQYRVLPTADQKLTINRWLDMLRLQCNYLLQQRFDWYEQNRCYINACPLICHLPEFKNSPNYYSQKKGLVQLKEERPWYSEIYSHVLQDMVKRVDLAMQRYIKGDCNGQRSGKPRFKGKARYRSFTFDEVNPNNTSQICSCCNARVPKDLSVRIHDCACGYIAHRDVNAAINIKKVGLGVFLTQKRSSGTTRKRSPHRNL